MGTSSDIKALKTQIADLIARVTRLEAEVKPPVFPPVVVPPPVTSSPIVIQILRHAEKPADASDHTLAPKGVLRAKALPPLFTVPRSDLYKPTYVFASKGSTTSMRMLQTAQPVATALGLSIDTGLDSENAISQTAALLAKQALVGKTVLAVLEHSALPAVGAALVKALGGTWTGKVPSSWDDADFHTGWKFVGDGAGHWTFSTFEESVLVGDPGYQAP